MSKIRFSLKKVIKSSLNFHKFDFSIRNMWHVLLQRNAFSSAMRDGIYSYPTFSKKPKEFWDCIFDRNIYATNCTNAKYCIVATILELTFFVIGDLPNLQFLVDT